MLRLAPRKAAELESRLNATASAPKKGSQPRKNVVQGESGDIVDCQCGYQEEEDHMVILLPSDTFALLIMNRFNVDFAVVGNTFHATAIEALKIHASLRFMLATSVCF